MRKYLSCYTALLATLMSTCATAGPVELSWDEAQVLMPNNEGSLYLGGWKNIKIQKTLVEIEPTEKLPVVISLHGCEGSLWPGDWGFWKDLAHRGYFLVAPSSFARKQPNELCAHGNIQLQMRVQELRYAISRLRELDWVDRDNIFVIGQSGSASVVGEYSGEGLKASVVAGYACSWGLKNRSNVLAVVSKHDADVRRAGFDDSWCSQASERLLLDSAIPDVLYFRDGKNAVRSFVFRNTSNPRVNKTL